MTRKRINLNRDWRFRRGDRDHEKRVGLPHTFDLPYFRTPEFFVGEGVYRKTFYVDDTWRSQRAFIEFEGVFQEAEVFVNDRRIGRHLGGYTGFSFDVTDAIRSGDNELVVRVNNEWNPRLAPRAGEHIFSGGIYRDVHLHIKSPLHVTWHGLFVTTAKVSRDAAVVKVLTEVRNDGEGANAFTLRARIFCGSRVVAETANTLSVAAGQTVEFDQTFEPITNPTLWSPCRPHLHVAELSIYDGERLVDKYEEAFGIRWFEWTADRGFFLNGEHLYLRGANVHQDHAGWGIGITTGAIRRDVKLMKEAGFNFVRGSHYPHDRAFAEACDELGLLMWSENCFWGKGGFGPEGYWNASAYPIDEADFEPFERSCKDALRDMIRINRNSPSIIAWSLTNEAFFTYNLDRARNLMRDLVKLSHELDPTRPAAIGGAQRGDIDRIGDVAGYNGDGARNCLDPGVPNMVSEYGAISKPPDAFEPFFGELQAEHFPWRSGQAIWAGFDYGSIAGKQGLKGIVDHQRLPKRSWHWYRNAYRGIAPPPSPRPGTPAKLRLDADPDHLNSSDASDDCQIVVTVLDASDSQVSNCPPVTLTIESGPGEFPTGRTITFDSASDIGMNQGRAAMAFRSYHGGKSLIRATAPGLEDATIMITTYGEPAWIEGVTAPVAPRPYVPPKPSQASIIAMNNAVNVALNRPCRASSESEGHPARFANDGERATVWMANDDLGSWTADLEGFYQLASLKIAFIDEGAFHYTVELSNDGREWTHVVDRKSHGSVRAERKDVLPPGAKARYVRIDFKAVPPGIRANLAEVEIYGILSVR